MFCPKCGIELDDEAVMCPGCGLMLDSYSPPADAKQPQANQPKKMRNVWKLVVGILFLLWSLQILGYNAVAFFIFGLIGGGLIFWWLLWDVYPKDKNKKEKEKSDHRNGPELP